MDGLESAFIVMTGLAMLSLGYIIHGVVDYLKRKTKA